MKSGFRNASLERILGSEKADSLFQQIQNIQSKEYLKICRSNQSLLPMDKQNPL